METLMSGSIPPDERFGQGQDKQDPDSRIRTDRRYFVQAGFLRDLA
jgi:hypothetical protein